MLNEQTQQKLLAMKMYGMASAFDEFLNQKGSDELVFEERFGLLVDKEFMERENRKSSRRLQSANLRESKACFEDIDYRHPRHLDKSVAQRLGSCQWVAKHENIIITGPTGIGKSWLACAFAHKACLEGYITLYLRVPRLCHSLSIARADGSYIKEMSRYAKTNILILDDWGMNPLGEMERRDMLEILEDRHGLSSTIITSQYPVKAWHDYIGDETIADAIMDRVVHNAHRIELSGPSIRKTKGEALDKELKN